MSKIEETRGLRNNNPGNLKHGSDWKGLTAEQTDRDFCQFTSVVYGIRALYKTLCTYFHTHNIRSIEQIIHRYAPPSDKNNTERYINAVCNELGILRNENLDDIPAQLIRAIIHHENGFHPFTIAFIEGCCAI